MRSGSRPSRTPSVGLSALRTPEGGRKYKINEPFEPVLTVESGVTSKKEVVYLLVSNRPERYPRGRSRIVYVGRTRNGIKRIAASAANKITEALENLRGVRRLRAFIVWTNPLAKERRHLPYVLERAILLSFRQEFGTVPRLNRQGIRIRIKDEFAYFRERAVHRIVIRYS